MLEHLIEFIGVHPILVGMFVVLLIAFVVNESAQGGASISSNLLVSLVNRDDAMILDIRDSKDYGAGHIVDAVNIPFTTFDQRASELNANKNKPIVVVCKMGQHSSAIGKKLKSSGFKHVHRLSGGIAEWTSANLPLVKG